jgi:hypothetical protein
LLFLLLALGMSTGWGASVRADSWTASTAITTVELNRHILADLGIEQVDVRPSAAPGSFPGFAFRTRPPSMLHFRAPGGDFERFDSGALHHEGGFGLLLPGESVPHSLDGFVLEAAPWPDDFHWLDAAGNRFFVLRHMQFTTSLASQELRLLNVSMHLAPELARRIGRPDLADVFVGVANLRLPALIPPDVAQGGTGAGICAATPGAIDVALTEIGSVSQIVREPGGRVALAPSAELENVGAGSVEWYESISPSLYDGVGPHPYLHMAVYRLEADGRLVQLGLGDVKHAYRALNLGCGCPSAALLYPGCGDVYGVPTNVDRQYLGPRQAVTARTGAWERVGSHFDLCLGLQPLACDPATDDADDYRDHHGESPAGFFHDDFEHRLWVREAELRTAGAAYFVEAWYLAAGDVDIFNSMGRRTVLPDLDGSVWSFGFGDDALRNGSVLAEIPNATLEEVDTGEGHLHLAVTSTELGGGIHRYRYTLMNFDFDRQVERFAVPLPLGAVVTNADSHAPGDEPAGDWALEVDANAISWQAPPGNALDWGMLAAFEFDANRSPGTSEVSLVVLEPGEPGALAVAAAVPVPEPRPSLLTGVALAVLARTRRRAS